MTTKAKRMSEGDKAGVWALVWLGIIGLAGVFVTGMLLYALFTGQIL